MNICNGELSSAGSENVLGIKVDKLSLNTMLTNCAKKPVKPLAKISSLMRFEFNV